MDERIASMVNRTRLREWLEEAIDEHVERFGESADSVVSSARHVEDGSHNEHYGEMTLEPLDVAQHWLGNEQIEGAYLFQIIKYLGRYRMNVPGKGGKTDLLKMRDYLNLLIDLKDECSCDSLSDTR